MRRPPSPRNKLIFSDIREKFLKGLCSISDLALKYSITPSAMSAYVGTVMKQVQEESNLEKKEIEKFKNSEEEVTKYGIPEKYKLKI